MRSLPIGLVLLLAIPPAVRAWGFDGHRIVCDLAWREARPETRAAIDEILAGDPDRPSFADACVWADAVIDDERYAVDRSRHYVNVPKGSGGFDRSRDCEGVCVVEGIETYARVLLDRAPGAERSRLEALKFLSHLVGDLHEPLHVGYAADRGGNEIEVSYFGRRSDEKGEPFNLHKVWDIFLIQDMAADWRQLAADLERRITPAERREWGRLDILAWATESFRLAEAEVYRIERGADIDRAYVEQHRGTVELRLQQAGVRLALLLDKVFAGEVQDIAFLQPDWSAIRDRRRAKRLEEGQVVVARFEGEFFGGGLPQAPTKAIPLGSVDLRFILNVRVLRLLEGEIPGGESSVTFAVHSPSLLFRFQGISIPEGRHVPDGKFSMTLWKDPRDRFDLEIVPVE